MPVDGMKFADGSSAQIRHSIDAPVRRIGALDTFVGSHPVLEEEILPQVGDLAAAVRDLARY